MAAIVGAAVVAGEVAVAGSGVGVSVAGSGEGVLAIIAVKRALAVSAAAVITALGSVVGVVSGAEALQPTASRLIARSNATMICIFFKLVPPCRTVIEVTQFRVKWGVVEGATRPNTSSFPNCVIPKLFKYTCFLIGYFQGIFRVSGNSCGDCPDLGPITEIPKEPIFPKGWGM